MQTVSIKKPRESDLVRACLQYFKAERILAWRSQSGMMFGEHAGKKRAVRMGIPGVPDIVALLPDACVFLIECKRPGKKQNPNQKWFEEAALNAGHLYWVVDNLKFVIETVEAHKLLAREWARYPDPPLNLKRKKAKP